MDTVMKLLVSVADFLSFVPDTIEETPRLAIMLFTALATGAGVGAVARNEDLNWLGKTCVAGLLFVLVFGVGLLISKFMPVFIEMAQMARGAGGGLGR